MSRLGAVGCEAKKEENLRGTAKGCWKKTQNKSTLEVCGKKTWQIIRASKAKSLWKGMDDMDQESFSEWPDI